MQNLGVRNPIRCTIKKVRPSIAARPHRVLTIEVWHQTSGGKGTNILREVHVGFHLAPADEAGKAFAAAVDPAGEFSPDGGVFGVGLDLPEECGPGEIAGADVVGEGEQGVELMLGDRKPVGHPAGVVEAKGEGEVVFEDPDVLFEELVRLFAGDGHSFIHTGRVAPADGPDVGRALVGVQAAAFKGVDENVCGFGCFHNDGDIKDSRLTRAGRESDGEGV